jgi:hypothetical protein
MTGGAGTMDAVRRPAVDPVDRAERTSGPHRRRRRRSLHSPVGLHAAVIAAYLVLAVVLWWRVWITGHPTTTITSSWGDPSQELWWLQWLPWAVLHGHNPFFTHAMNAGMGGVNGLANPSVYLPSLVAAPFTLLFGPVLSFNLLATVSPVFSAWCMFLLCRRVTSFVPGQVLAGALWGFSPFVVTNLPLGHLNLVTGFFPPLAALVAINLVDGRGPTGVEVGRRSTRYRTHLLGLALAGLIVAEFFVSTEALVDSFLLGLVAALSAVVIAPRRIWAAQERIIRGVAVAGATSAVVLAYPAWFATAGPATVSGDLWSNNGLGLDGSTVLHPGPYVHATGVLTALVGYFGPSGPSYLYLGIPLVVFLAISSVVWYRRRLAWVVVATGFLAWTFSLGQPPGGSLRPWGYLRRIPLLQAVQPQRFADLVMFCAAVLLALSLDAWWRAALGVAANRRPRAADGTTGSRWPRRGWEWVAPSVLTVVGVLVLVPIAATYTVFVEHPGTTPSWYLTAARSLPAGSRLLSVPLPDLFPTSAMTWQAQDDFAFDMIGGYAIVPGRDGRTDSIRAPFLGPTRVLQNLSAATSTLPTAPNDQTSEVRHQLGRWHVSVVVVASPTRQPTFAASYLTAVLGRTPVYDHGAWVWLGLGTAPAMPLTAGQLQSCAAQALRSSDPLAGPRCVMAGSPTG